MKFSIFSVLSILALFNVVIGAYTNQELLDQVKKASTKVLTLTDKNYEKYLNGPRDYHVVMLLSSQSPQFKCPLCNEFKPEYELVANSWNQDHPNGVNGDNEKDIFFFYSEFMNSKDFFQKLKLNNIPKCFYLPPSTISAKDGWVTETDEYQFFQGQHATLIIDWLRSVTEHKFNLHVPINYTRIAVNAGITFGVLVLAFIFNKQVMKVLTSKTLWTGAAIFLILLFNAGYMFNQIRQMPYVREHPDGRVDYWVQGQQAQLGFETQLVSFIYGILSLLVLLLIKQVPKIQHPQVKLIAATLVSVSLFLGYSLLLNFFGLKSPGYPFRFVKFVK
ncbi:dolichyl-diphosphooligosaccharide--protein glycosyltransferase subunit 3 [[Candida] jaroonii]|uniref:Dolichyl-diphosphooligosaccharide--protein glycosyltransferase subunit 3 n=1 Tax=[Candida] jaroonii TaxID=467808 RepID=A0ACA9Y1R2_9ASCO|nr:dolichyl-diphosphooligosaccharide--protein glycosyltransferase subunit 3 [[Candida] jaroonii]